MGGSEDTVVSMKLSLEVEVTDGEAGVSFEFDPGIESVVKQYRYEKENGILNIYVSGNSKQKVFQTEEFSLGKVVLDPGEGESASAVVRVKEDSLEIVNDAYDRQQGRINASPEQKITVGRREEESNPDGDDTEAPSVSEPEEEGSGNSGGSGGSGGGKSPDGGNAGPTSEPVKGRPSVENRRPAGRDVGIRSGNLQTADADADTAPDTEQELSEEEPELEEQQKEEDEPELKPEPEQEDMQEPEAGPDIFLLAGTAVGVAAAGLVIFLMVLEYRKKEKKKDAKVEKSAKTAKEKGSKNGKKSGQRRGTDHLS